MKQKSLSRRNESVRREKWKTLHRAYPVNSPWLRVRKETVLLPSGKVLRNFFTIEGGNIAAVLALNAEGDILLVRQYRHAIGRTTIDLPGGNVEKNEHPKTAAQRELAEETGFRARHLTRLFTYFPDSGRKSGLKYLYFASGLYRGKKASPTHEEGIQYFWTSPKKLISSLKSSSPIEATLLIGLLSYMRNVARKKIPSNGSH